MANAEEVVFCADWTTVPGTNAAYGAFWHEAEVFVYTLANAVERGEMTAGEALEAWAPYRKNWELEEGEIEELKEDWPNGFPTVGWFTEWGPGPGTEDFWRAADRLGIPGVVYSEGDHPGGGPYFEVRRREALEELREALAGQYKIVVREGREYDTSGSSDLEEAKRIIEQARKEPYSGGGRD